VAIGRCTNVVGRWGEKTFLILLPETRLTSAIQVTKKIHRILKTKRRVYDDKTYKVSAKFGTVEYVSSLKESLDRVMNKISNDR